MTTAVDRLKELQQAISSVSADESDPRSVAGATSIRDMAPRVKQDYQKAHLIELGKSEKPVSRPN